MNSVPGTSSLTQDQILNYMYQGEKKRDASSKICGFMFQDLVALDYLLDESTESVVLEFIEDVTVKRTDGSILCVQAKYFPNSEIPSKNIIRDLYYQYLRLSLFSIKSPLSFQLAYHHESELTGISFADMKKFIPTSVNAMSTNFQPANLHQWLCDNIYNGKKVVEGKEKNFTKDDQEQVLFDYFSTESRIRDFYHLYSHKYFSDLTTYRIDLANRLEQLPQIAHILAKSDTTGTLDSEQISQILLGAALLRIQERYINSNSDSKISNLKITRTAFLNYLENQLFKDTNQQISSYLVSLVNKKQADIISRNPGISQNLLQFLSICAHKTSIWIAELGMSTSGQLQLLNTLSRKDSKYIQKFEHQSSTSIFHAIIACEDNIDLFLDYLWKIMYDMCLQNPEDDILKYADILDPCTYIVPTEKRYICLHFKNDYVNSGAILPHIRKGKEIEDIETIWERMQGPRPQKWYLPGSKRGLHNYAINPARMNEKPSVVDQNQFDTFYIECMDCIKIDADTWLTPENCSNCIFQKSCIKKSDERSSDL